MPRRTCTRRAALRSIGLGVTGTVTATSPATATTEVTPSGQRPDERIQFVEADPDSGFNFPYWLATPETFRSKPVPLLITMNHARVGQPLTGGGPDQPTTVAEWARSKVKSFKQIGAWASEQLGIPQLVPVFPMPNRTQRTIQLDRETLLIEGGDLERIDRQFVRMTEHARSEIFADREIDDQFLIWGHSAAAQAAEHMAVLHPEKVLGFAASGINGAVTLPLEELGDYTLKYQVGVADLQEITGKPFDAEAFDAVNKFYIQGAHDTSDRLKFKVPGELSGTWADPEVYETAKAVYGRDMVEDRLPRCHIAFEKAGISGQFRVYPEMTHDPGPLMRLGGPDILEFYRRSIAGEDVSGFGQRLTLPFDRTVRLQTSTPAVGDPLEFAVSGDYPPPEGLVSYDWQVDDGRSASGKAAKFTFEEASDYEVVLSMETAHGQTAERGMSLLARGNAFGAYRYDVTPPRTDLVVGQSILIEIVVTNVGSAKGDRRVEFFVDGDRFDSLGTALDPGNSKRILFSHPFDAPGEFEVSAPPAYKETITVKAEPTPTRTSGSSKTNPDTSSTDSNPPTDGPATTTSAQTPGLGVLPALAAIGSAVSYLLFTDDSDGG